MASAPPRWARGSSRSARSLASERSIWYTTFSIGGRLTKTRGWIGPRACGVSRCTSPQVCKCWLYMILASSGWSFSIFLGRWKPSDPKRSISRTRSSLPSAGSLPGAAAAPATGSSCSSVAASSTGTWLALREARSLLAGLYGALLPPLPRAPLILSGVTNELSLEDQRSVFNFINLFSIDKSFDPHYYGTPRDRSFLKKSRYLTPLGSVQTVF